jgi:16S rRNA (cytidine1402-2'-O)-methyltransferase
MAGTGSDLTRRALQVLASAALVLADGEVSVQRLLAQLNLVASPLEGRRGAALEALGNGDVAFLATGWLLGLSEPGAQLVRAALQRGLPVVPIPGPVLPLTALILSGLPAHSFVWIGELSRQSGGSSLLAGLGHDPRTIIALASASTLVDVCLGLHSSLGSRPLVVVAPSDLGARVIWRGTLDELPESTAVEIVSARCVLIVGGSQEPAPRWDEARLRADVETLRARGLGAREISQQLAERSGWPRRQVYRMVVEAGRPANQRTEEV